MKKSLMILLVLSPLLLSVGWAATHPVFTDLKGWKCREDKTGDPDETPYGVCPGPGSYYLDVLHVDAGRQSITIVDSSRGASYSLNVPEFITRYMFSLSDKAEWRMTTKDGKQIPVALIFRVHVHEDNANPEKVTRSYLAVAKITLQETCITDRIPADDQGEDKARQAADSAGSRPCLPALPPINP